MRISELVFEAKATKTRLDKKCWKGKKIGKPKTKVKGGVRVNNCVPKESIDESNEKGILLKTITIPGDGPTSGTYKLMNLKGHLYIMQDDVFLNPESDNNDAVNADWKEIEQEARSLKSQMTSTWSRGIHEDVELGDVFFLELGGLLIESTVIGTSADSIIIEGDDITIKLLEKHQQLVESVQLDEKAVSKKQQRFMGMVHAAKKGETPASPEVAKAAKGMSKKAAKDFAATKHKGLPEKKKANEAKYQGREVPLGKPMAGDVKKSKVYVKKPNGKVVKVNFGDKKMRIKKSNPKRRKSFRARHNCSNPGPRWKARYWSCRAW